MGHIEDCHSLAVEVERFAEVMSSMARDEAVPTCPGWTVVDLAGHLGVIHRWAEELVRLRSPERIPRESLDNDDDVRPEWITSGGRRLVATLLGTDPDESMWAWGLDQRVRFWSRRQLHETLVHRMDLELAAHVSPQAESAIALDAIDEYLSNLEKVARHPTELSSLRGHGETLAFRDGDSGRLWAITLGEDGFSVSDDEQRLDAELVSDPVNLLLVILGRRSLDQEGVDVSGDRKLVDFWLDHSAFT